MSLNPNSSQSHKPDNDEVIVRWAQLVRQFLSRQNNDFLPQAILEAQKHEEPEIINCLQAFAAGQTDEVDRLAEQLVPRLKRSQRYKEALTINLLSLHPKTLLVETYVRYAVKHQKQAKELGIDACQKSIQISESLNDKPCQALYSGKLAIGFSNSHEPLEAEFFNKQAVQLYRDCAMQEPHIFLQNVAATLNSLGIAQSTQRKLKEAEGSYTEAFEIYQKLAETKPHVFLKSVAITLSNLGITQIDQKELAKAETSLAEALKIRRRLDKTQPGTFLQDIAALLNNLGNIQNDRRKLSRAESTYIEALGIYRKLAETAPHVFLQKVAMILSNLGSAQREQRKLRESEKSCVESLEIRRSLAEAEPHIFLQDVAATLNNLGTTQSSQRRLKEAEDSFAEALEIYQKLAETKPQIFLPVVATVSSNLGVAQSHRRKLKEAETSLAEALRIYRKLAEGESHIFLQDLASTLNNLGTIQTERQRLEEAETSFAEALEIRRKLAETEPHIFLPKVASTLSNIGVAQSNQRKLKEAEKSYVEALSIYRKLAETEPHIFLPEVAAILTNLGAMQRRQSKLTETEISHTEALSIYRKLAETEPYIFLQDIAMVLSNLGTVQVSQKKPGDAVRSHTEALGIYRKLAETEPDIFLPDVATGLSNLGTAQWEQKKWSESESSFGEALEIRKCLAEGDPQLFLHSVAATLNSLGASQRGQKKLAEAEISFAEALAIYRKLAKRKPHVFLPEVANLLNSLGTAQWSQIKLTEGEISYIEALKIYRKLAKKAPDIFNASLALVLHNLGYLKFAQDQPDEAGKKFESARELIEDLRAKVITIDDRNRILQENANIYSGLLACHIKMKDYQKALTIAEQGKSRSLSDLLNLKSEYFQPNAQTSQDLVIVRDLGLKYSDAIKELQRIESHERQLSEQLSRLEDDTQKFIENNENNEAVQPISLQQISEKKQFWETEKRKAQNQRFARQTELKSILEEINRYDKNFPPKAKEISNKEIIEIAGNLNRTIVIFRVLLLSTAIIFVFPDGRLEAENIPKFGQDELFQLFSESWLIPYQQWKKTHPTFHLKEADWQNSPSAAAGAKDWLYVMEETLETLYQKLMIHVHRILRKKSLTKEVLFIPSQSLAALPLHAASWIDKKKKKHYLLEEFTISYCPSLSVFKRCRENEKRRTDRTLLINNPGRDLSFSEKEVEFIKKNHRLSTDLRGRKATRAAVLRALQDDYSFTHFACHGFYNWENQFDSGLIMSNGVLKLSEIINCNLQNNWLTTLSACETGIVDFSSPTDEHFGLPLGFIFAGSPSIWASLWSVSDEATSLLMQKAYENLNKEEFQNNKPEALRHAQLLILKKYPHPYYWAGFQHFGM